MPDQIYIGNFAKGLKTDRLPFNIDNDAFPTLYNMYSWRGRIKRKRGTKALNRLQRNIEFSGLTTLNLLEGLGLEVGSSIVPGTVDIFGGGGNEWTDDNADGILFRTPGPTTGTVNYATGAITGPNLNLSGTFSYYPALPVMGLEDFTSGQVTSQYPLLLAFDTVYAYQINQAVEPNQFYQVNYYKTTQVEFTWSGQDYQQFWSTNYSGAFWATNNVPGLNLVNATYLSQISPNILRFNFVYPSFSDQVGMPFTTLVLGDVLWFNEWNPATSSINNVTGIVSAVGSSAAGNYQVTFASPVMAAGTGIAQLLTNSISTAITGIDGIKWYDGDPTSGTGLPTATGLGWVNFAPPLTALTVSIDNTPAAKYYLVGALAILPFKDRLLFFRPYIQTSSGTAIQLDDTVLWSWNGTPYYTVDSLGAPSEVPAGEVADVRAYYVDQTGFGGYLPAGIPQPIKTISNNEDALIIGFGGDGRKTRFVYTGDDIQPFLFFNINSEMPSQSTFSAVPLDRGVLDIGQYGIAMTDQQSCARVDLDIPDEVFKIQALNSGSERVNALRDFFREWVYFSYPVNNSSWKFPTQTFLFNYRDNTWAILYENYTHHGLYRKQTKRTWRTTGFKTWSAWKEPWNSGSSSPLFNQVIAGNPQGYVIQIGEGTGESPSGYISAIASNVGGTQITSYDHCVKVNDYLYITDAVGLDSFAITGITLGDTTAINVVNTFAVNQNVTITGVVGTTQLNGNTYRIIATNGLVIEIDVDSNDFTPYVSGGFANSAFNNLIGKVTSIPKLGNVDDPDKFIIDLQFPSGTYLGAGQFTRLSQPLVQTKEFPFYWDQGRQTRLCAQKYLMDYTTASSVTVNIYLSQDFVNVWNEGAIVPSVLPNPVNNSLIYSQLLYTCPESTNIGLTPANTNLQMPIANYGAPKQIWHRLNTSLIGDSVQIGITLNDAQMRNLTDATSEITLHGMHLTVDKGPLLA